jgi:hypothetical protein
LAQPRSGGLSNTIFIIKITEKFYCKVTFFTSKWPHCRESTQRFYDLIPEEQGDFQDIQRNHKHHTQNNLRNNRQTELGHSDKLGKRIPINLTEYLPASIRCIGEKKYSRQYPRK